MQNLKNISAKLLIPFISLVKLIFFYALPSRLIKPTAIDVLNDLTQESSARYIDENIDHAMIFNQRTDLWSYSINSVSVNGMYVEFGVSWGKSINYISKILKSGQTITGFDSFLGLKEDFLGTKFTKNSFSTGGKIPKVGKNVELRVGWFSDTIPKFLSERSDLFSFIHMDADTYTSTTEVLELIKDRISDGTILVFDEYIGVPNWQNNEYKAWTEFVRKYKIKYQYIAFSSQAVAIRVI
jgi:predicted O-methyltransferase YrrM